MSLKSSLPSNLVVFVTYTFSYFTMSDVRYSDKWWFLRLILEFISDWRGVQFHDS